MIEIHTHKDIELKKGENYELAGLLQKSIDVGTGSGEDPSVGRLFLVPAVDGAAVHAYTGCHCG
jgi:hypothetical protein